MSHHFRPNSRTLLRRRTSVIWLFMEGGPSGFDLFDPKPELQKRNGQRVDGIETHFGNPGPLLASPYFIQAVWPVGPLVLRKVFDPGPARRRHRAHQELLAESPNHGPAMYQMNTGITRPGFPSVGAWVTYGLGTENQNLPGFVVMAGGVEKGGALNWGGGFLPTSYQGTLLRTSGQPILNLRARPASIAGSSDRMLDLAAKSTAGTPRHIPARRNCWAASRASSWLTACRWKRRR